MQPIRQTGETVAVSAGAAAAAAKPSSVVWVTNQSTTTWAMFSTQSTSGGTPDANGIPVPPNSGIIVAIPHNAQFYAASGGALTVTPVEMMKSQ